MNNVGKVEATKTIFQLSPNFNFLPVRIERIFANKVYSRVYKNVRKRVDNHMRINVISGKLIPNA